MRNNEIEWSYKNANSIKKESQIIRCLFVTALGQKITIEEQLEIWVYIEIDKTKNEACMVHILKRFYYDEYM